MNRIFSRKFILVWLVLLGLAGLLGTGCAALDRDITGPATAMPAGSGIVFVTPTPTGVIRLEEGQQFRAEVEATPTARPYFAGANELGQVMVLEYHRIGYPEQRYQRTPDNFRADLERLYREGYYPVNFIDLLRGLEEVPAGKKPVVLTFDDSDISQFRVLSDNSLDTDSAVGILLDFHSQHPLDWPTRATFFMLGNDNGGYRSIFGQANWAKAKAQLLVELGMELGSHTVTHADLSVATAERIYWELALSKHVIEKLVPGYTVQSLSVPFGGYPYTSDFLKSGQWQNYSYSYVGNAAAWGGPGPSPFDADFDPYDVSRLEVTSTFFEHWLTYFVEHPEEYYVSDGDPERITYPGLEAAKNLE